MDGCDAYDNPMEDRTETKGNEIKSNKTWCAWMNCRISPRQTEVQEQGKAVYFQIRKNIQDRRPDGLGIKYARKDASEYRAKLHLKEQAWEDKKQWYENP